MVPARWSGPRLRPGPPLPPVRPIDRVSASVEVTEIRRVGALRRQHREALQRLRTGTPTGDGPPAGEEDLMP